MARIVLLFPVVRRSKGTWYQLPCNVAMATPEHLLATKALRQLDRYRLKVGKIFD
jgi:hypothetical protein